MVIESAQLTIKNSTFSSLEIPRMTGLCFLPAAEAKKAGSITDTEYIHHLLSHLLGLEYLHDGDDYPNYDPGYDLPEVDPFAHSVKSWVINMVPNPLKGIPTLLFYKRLRPNCSL
jgi:hypothetical protein